MANIEANTLNANKRFFWDSSQYEHDFSISTTAPYSLSFKWLLSMDSLWGKRENIGETLKLTTCNR
jgi:hypothetical protein